MRTMFVMNTLGQTSGIADATSGLECAAYQALLDGAQSDVDDAANQLAAFSAQIRAAAAAGDNDTINALSPQLNSVQQTWNTAQANYQQALLNFQQCQRKQAGMGQVRLIGGYNTPQRTVRMAQAPAPAPSPADDFQGPCPEGTTQTSTGCAPNVASVAPPVPAAPAVPAAKAPVGVSNSKYIAGAIAAVAIVGAIFIVPGK